jgi:hypothetical protein
MNDRIYKGVRSGSSRSANVEVTFVDGNGSYELSPRLDLKEYSADGFEWGYGNSGPSQLALAILADVTGSDDYALRHHIWFKLEVISRLPWHGWELSGQQVWAWINEHHPLSN